MKESLPRKRFWRGYSVVAASVLLTLLLWVASMWLADDWHHSPWMYPAKVGSHGTIVLMCWAFFLASRLQPAGWLFGGLDKVYKAHRRIAETAFFLIFLHPIFLAVAFAGSLSEFLRFLWFSDDWVRNTGIIALLAFAVLVALSIYVKIAYHLWKWSHQLFGLLLILIVVHAVMADGEIMQYPVLTVWHGAWVALALAAYIYIRVLYRFIGPQYDYTTASVEEVGDAITEIFLTPRGRPLHFAPGQFIYISFEADAVSKESHPFSISSPPESQHLRLSIKDLGDWTEDVSEITAGKKARIWGPYGRFSKTLLDRPDLPAVMIGGGIGITPFLSILGSKPFANRSGRSTLIYSVPEQADAVYRDELRQRASANANLRLVEHFSDEEGFIDHSYLEDIVNQPLTEYLYMICGPPPMLEALRSLLSDAGVSAKQVFVEDFDIR
jgi:predicted ferric reductase